MTTRYKITPKGIITCVLLEKFPNLPLKEAAEIAKRILEKLEIPTKES